jgi:hypothetical protein
MLLCSLRWRGESNEVLCSSMNNPRVGCARARILFWILWEGSSMDNYLRLCLPNIPSYVSASRNFVSVHVHDFWLFTYPTANFLTYSCLLYLFIHSSWLFYCNFWLIDESFFILFIVTLFFFFTWCWNRLFFIPVISFNLMLNPSLFFNSGHCRSLGVARLLLPVGADGEPPRNYALQLRGTQRLGGQRSRGHQELHGYRWPARNSSR